MAYDTLIDKAAENASRKYIADRIRAKGGTTAPLGWPRGYGDAVDAIAKQKPEQTKSVRVEENGLVLIEPDPGKVISKATVMVDVPNDTADATATEGEVFAGETAYLATGKKTGTFTIASELAAQQTKLTAIEDALKDKAAGKPEQTKTVEITANGDTTITPDPGKTLSSVLAKVNVSGGGIDLAPYKYLVKSEFTPASNTTTIRVEGTYKGEQPDGFLVICKTPPANIQNGIIVAAAGHYGASYAVGSYHRRTGAIVYMSNGALNAKYAIQYYNNELTSLESTIFSFIAGVTYVIYMLYGWGG